MKDLFLLLILALGSCGLRAQDFVLVTVGEAYGLQTYYRFSDDREVRVDNDDWDLAFAFRSNGIFVNESSKSTFLEPAREIRLYPAPVSDFSTPFAREDVVGGRLWNDEQSWAWGALNEGRDSTNPSDMGWGQANGLGQVIGDKVYAIRLRNGSWKKFRVTYRDAFEYRLQYANLDNTDLREVTLPIPDFSPEFFGYFSFSTGGNISAIPAFFDLAFLRYYKPLDDMEGGLLDYAVNGVLLHPEVQAARATGVVPAAVTFDTYRDSMTSRPDLIGHEWKTFDFENTFEWTVYDDLAFFVLDHTGNLWKMAFVDFEGTVTGNIVFQKWDLGRLVSTDAPEESPLAARVIPNPSNGTFELAFHLAERQEGLRIELLDVSGTVMRAFQTDGIAGLNARHIDTDLPQGTYFVRILAGGAQQTLPLVIRH